MSLPARFLVRLVAGHGASSRRAARSIAARRSLRVARDGMLRVITAVAGH